MMTDTSCMSSQCAIWGDIWTVDVHQRLFLQWSQTHNQYIRRLHTNEFIGRKTQEKKKVCAVQQTQSTKTSGRHFSYWETRDKIRSVQCTLIQTAASESIKDVFGVGLRIINKTAQKEFSIKEQMCSSWFSVPILKLQQGKSSGNNITDDGSW